MSGDLDDPGEYMGLKINGTTVCVGQTGFQDATMRTFGCFDVTDLLKNNRGAITLEAYASAGVGTPAGVVNTLEAHFVHPFGEPTAIGSASPAQKYTFTPLQASTTPIIQTAAPRSSSVCLTKRALSLGESKIDLKTFAQVGYSLTSRLRDPNGMLSDLFKSRKRPFGYVTGNKTAVATNWGGLNVTPVAADAGKWYFIGAETMFAESWSGGALSMIRGCYNSEAKAAEGTLSTGQNLYEAVAGYTGRRAQLWVGYKHPSPRLIPNEEGQSSKDLASMGWAEFEQVGTFRLEDAPEFEGGERFTLNLSDLSTFFANRKAMVNCRSVQRRGAWEPVNPSEVWRMPIKQPDGKKLEKGNAVTWLLAKSTLVEDPTRDYTEVNGVFPYTYDPNYVELFLPDILGLYDWGTLPEVMTVDECRQVYAVRGDPIHGILTILESWDGAGAYGSYDSLPGVPEPATLYEETFRMGAGIRSTDIDEVSFLNLQGLSMPWSFILQDELEVKELLAWLCVSARVCWYVTPTGNLTVKPFDLVTSPTDTAALTQLDSGDILRKTEDKGNASERHVACSFQVKTNYNTQNEPTQTINFADFQTLKKYPSADRVTTYEMPFIQTESSTAMRPINTFSAMVPVSINDLEFEIRRKMKMNERGIFTTSVVLPWKYAGVELGDKVQVSNPYLFNFNEGKQTALGTFFVIGKQMDVNEGTIKLGLVALYGGRAICQAGEVSSYNAGSQTVTFNPTSGEWGADPADYFNVNMNIKIWDESAGAFNNEVVASTSGNDITLSGVPAATYAAGDIVMIREYGSNANGPSEFADPESLGLFAVEEGLLGSANDEGSRLS